MLRQLFYNKSISNFNRISLLFATLLTVLFMTIILYNAYSDYKFEINKIEREYFLSQKEFVKKETQRALRFIKYKYKKDINNKPLQILQDEIVDAIEQMRNINDGTGYIFIYDFNGVNIADPILKKNRGKNLINFTDSNGKKVIKELIDISKNKDGGYVKYVWNKPTTNKQASKISYAASFLLWKWMIGSGVYLDEIENVLKRKKDEYNKKILNYIVQIIIVSFLLFLGGLIIYRYFTTLIAKDIEKIRLTLKSLNTIDIRQITFKEFRQVAQHTNTMTRELKDLNKNLEQKVVLRTKELEESKEYALNLVEQQDKFIKDAIHEINTPLSIIITNIDLFKLKFSNNKYLSKIEAGSKIIHNIYNDLEYMVKKDRIEYPKQNISLSTFIKNRVDFFNEIALGNQLSFKLKVQDNINIFFSLTLLQRICDNTLSNAIKYSFTKENIFINLYIKDESIIFEVINKGENIKDISKLFDRFYRENSSRGGFGLGLNIIKEICEDNDVNMEVESKDDLITFRYIFKMEIK